MIDGKRIKRVIYIYEDDTQDSIDIPVYPREQSPKWPEINPYRTDAPREWSNPYKTCPKCGLDLSGPMGYCCPNGDCPTGLGGSRC